MGAGAFLFYAHPFPDQQIFLHVIAMRAPQAFLSFKYIYYTLLFTTPYIVCSAALSGLYIFTLKGRQKVTPGRLPLYPDLRIKPPDPTLEPEAQDRSELDRFKEAARAEARYPIPVDEITPYKVADSVRYADGTLGPSPQGLKVIRRYMADDAAAGEL